MEDPGGYIIFPEFLISVFLETGTSLGLPLGIGLTVVLVMTSGLISASEVAFFSLSPLQLDALPQSSVSVSRLKKLLEKPKALLATVLLLNNLVNIGIIVVSDSILNQFNWGGLPEWTVFLIRVVLISFIILLFGEIIPKVYARKYQVKLSLMIAPVMLVLVKICRPFTWPLTRFTSFFDRRIKNKVKGISVDKLSHALDLTTESKSSTEEQKILRGIVQFGSLDVKAIITPRTAAVTLSIDTPFHEVLKEIQEKGHSRIPVYKEKEDQIEGILYIKDIVPYLNEGPDFEWHKLIREPFFVPESKKIDDLLKEFQTRKMHMAIVVDEFGGFEGLVTLEDIIEEIIGEINDEHDDDDVDYFKMNDTNFIFAGKTSLTDFLRIMEIDRNFFDDFDSEPESIAGVLLEICGKIPAKDDSITYKNLTFRVLNADKRRVNRVKVTVDRKTQPAGTDQNNKLKMLIFILFGLSILYSCGNGKEKIVRPKGYFEIKLPEKKYQVYDKECPFTFEYPVYSGIRPYKRDVTKTCWFDVYFPKFKATLHLSYEDVTGRFVQFSEDQHTLAYKHTSKANAIDEIFIEAPEDKVWGIIYNIEGDAASNYQFHVTDSQKHFLRGSLYFDFKANPDSVAPVLNFLKQDVMHLVETVRWK